MSENEVENLSVFKSTEEKPEKHDESEWNSDEVNKKVERQRVTDG